MLTRTAQVAFNTLASAVRFIFSIGVWVVLTPIMVHRLGQEQFGLWTLIFSTLGLLSLLDFGIGTGVVKAVAEATGKGDIALRNRMVSTYAVAYTVMGLVSAVGVVILAGLFPTVFAIPESERTRTLATLLIVGARSAVLLFPLSLFRGILFGQQQIAVLNAIQAATTLLYACSVAWALTHGAGIVALACLNLAAMLVEHAAYIVVAYRKTPDLHIRFSLASRALFRDAVGLSVSQLVIALSGLILLRTDPIIIKLFLPMQAVAIYAVALKISENSFLFVKQFVNATSPLVAQLHGQGDDQKIRFILVNAAKLAFAPGVVLACGATTLGTEIIVHWVGQEFAQAGLVLTLLVWAMALMVPQMVAFGVLTYTDRHAFPARAAIASAVANVVFTLLLVRRFGLVGIAAGTLLATLVVDVGWVLPHACRLYHVPLVTYFRRVFVTTLIPGLVQGAVTMALKTLWPPHHLLSAVLLGVPGALMYVAVFWFVALDPTEKDLIRNRLLRFRRTA
jgi:O-antigen/teichoic acid export membrane protein